MSRSHITRPRLYGDDLARPAIAHSGYTDRQTADEDRPM